MNQFLQSEVTHTVTELITHFRGFGSQGIKYKKMKWALQTYFEMI